MMQFDEDPIFDQNYLVKNIPNISYPTEQGMRTIIFMLNKDGLPCRRQYLNGRLYDDLIFADFDTLQIYMKNNLMLFDEFCEFMKVHEKEHAKRIRITKRYEEIQ